VEFSRVNGASIDDGDGDDDESDAKNGIFNCDAEPNRHDSIDATVATRCDAL
jgi:hypothetical protein